MNCLCLILTYAFVLRERVSCNVIYNTPGTVSETSVSNFEFLQRLGNPCGVVRYELEPSSSSSPGLDWESIALSHYFMEDRGEEANNDTFFYSAMVIAGDRALQKLTLLQFDPMFPDCRGINLDTLPATTNLFNDSTGDALFPDIYRAGILLAAHLHIMMLDRELAIMDHNHIHHHNDHSSSSSSSSWRYLRCGNETEDFIQQLADLVVEVENILCTLVSTANWRQRVTFRRPFNELLGTVLLRYHNSCSTMQVRDCLVLRATKQTLEALIYRFRVLLQAAVVVEARFAPRDHNYI